MDYENLKRGIIKWLREKVSQAGKEGGVVGLSGGVDSAVVSYLCREAYDENFQPLILPCESRVEDLEDAHLIEEFLGLKAKVVDLTSTFHSLCSLLPPGTMKSVANLKPRLRMLALYYFANTYNKLVVGTGNKSELLLGYFTKYGDGGVDILPLGDLFKTQVREFARYLGIPRKIIEKPPSAGLWEGQTDEEEIGLSYEMVDKILEAWEKGKGSEGFSKENWEKVKSMIESSKHKRRMPEVFKISSFK